MKKTGTFQFPSIPYHMQINLLHKTTEGDLTRNSSKNGICFFRITHILKNLMLKILDMDYHNTFQKKE